MIAPGSVDDESLIEHAESIARQLLLTASMYATPWDDRQRARIASVIDDPTSQEFLVDLTDQVLRIANQRSAGRRLCEIVRDLGVPAFAGSLERVGLKLASKLAGIAPWMVMPAVIRRIRREFDGIVLPQEKVELARHIRQRHSAGVRLNVNLLGEAILGEREAEDRLRGIEELLARPEVDYVSVKISAICSRLSVVAYEESITRIVDRLVPIYRVARSETPQKFVNLDMEEYRDLALTVDAFVRALSRPELHDIDAGIVMQAYLPESIDALRQICEFAYERKRQGGGTVKVRLVKGANLAMERVEAELRGWPQAPFGSKCEVDANLKRMLDLAIAPRYRDAVRVGVGSHNLFDVGWALAVRDAIGAPIEVEMLEGMANAQALATKALAGEVLLYAPVVGRDDFPAAVAYLVRRFDENTFPGNFLAQLFSMSPDSTTWDEERDKFRSAVRERREPTPPSARRANDRTAANLVSSDCIDAFRNEADTDFTLASNRDWLGRAVDAFRSESAPRLVPSVVAGEAVFAPMTGIGIDPSAPSGELYRYVESDIKTVDHAVTHARRACQAWLQLGAEERCARLEAAARIMGHRRGESVATMMHDAGKIALEADAEVSEAIDFARYYAGSSMELWTKQVDSDIEPLGVVVITPPWNFPYAIPAGGIFGSLAAGNAVIVKPAPETVLTAYALVSHCWEAGIPRDVLQFLPCADGEVGRHLITHPGIDGVVFTGAWDTARMFLEWRPSLDIRGETSGKNAMVITAAADQDDAIRDLLDSAFSHSGQKCSAASLGILEASVYEDGKFLRRLANAAQSMRVGPATDVACEVGPLIRPPSGPLLRALTELSPGERWLVKPEPDPENPQLWSPGIKLGISPGSEFWQTECFGPVLGLTRAEDLRRAIDLQNSMGFGLTGGIHSLDPSETAEWCQRVEVGNAYINRAITGAIVRRQPFGGWKRSAIGSFAKSGGPNYVFALGRHRGTQARSLEEELETTLDEWARLSVGEDPSNLRPELNVFRLRSLDRVSLRLGTACNLGALPLALAIAKALQVSVDLSSERAIDEFGVRARVENDAAYCRRLAELGPCRVRLCSPDPVARLAALDYGLEVDASDLSPLGRIELLHWTREQTVSVTLHRHGNVRGGRRELVDGDPVQTRESITGLRPIGLRRPAH